MQAQTTRLMLQAKGGDQAAFDQLVESLRGQAFQVAHSLVGSREDALELTQEAFLKTYRARADFREGEHFLPWFHRILRNTCYSFLRKRGRLSTRALSELGGGNPSEDDTQWVIEDDGPAPDWAMEQDERSHSFWRGFRSLPGTDREILALRHFQELPYQSIAQTLDIPVGTVMSRLFHARRRLRESLGQEFQEPALQAPQETTLLTRARPQRRGNQGPHPRARS